MRAGPHRILNRETLSFLLVGGCGYAVDVGAFNLIWGRPPFDTWDPVVAKTLAVGLGMVVTYLGNALVTWRGRTKSSLRQVLLFVVFNLVGLSFSIVALLVSHDVAGLTSRLADNISANVVGLALGTAFRFWSYRRFVFDGPQPGQHDKPEATMRRLGAGSCRRLRSAA